MAAVADMIARRGKAREFIAFERLATVASPLGPKRETWAAIAGSRRSATIYWGSGSERRGAAGSGDERRAAAGTVQAVQAATFVVLADSVTQTITARDRITYAGLAWGITSIAAPDRREVQFTATAIRG
jgi:hypothetical protein